MIKDQEKRKMLGVVFVLMDDYVSSLTTIEFGELRHLFEQLILDVLTLENGPYPVGSKEKEEKFVKDNDIILDELFDRSPDDSKHYVDELGN